MKPLNGPVLDMTPDGTFIEPRKPTLGAILVRLAIFGLVLCIGAVMFWTTLILLPFLLLLGVIGYFVARSRFIRL